MTIRFLLVCITCIPGLLSQAQRQLGLDDCYRIALKSNIAIKRAENNVQENLSELTTSRYHLLPIIGFRMDHEFSFGKNIDPVSNTFVNETFKGGSLELDIELKIFSGFSTLYTIKGNKFLYEASQYEKRKIELDVLTRITLSYARILFNKEQVSTLRRNLETTGRQLEIIAEKIRLGKSTKNEYDLITARMQTEKAELVSAQNDWQLEIRNLKQLLNIGYKDSVDILPIDTNLLSGILRREIPSGEFVSQVLEKHPAIRQVHLNERAAMVLEKASRSTLFPSFSMGVNFASNYNLNEEDANGSKIPVHNQVNNNFGQTIYAKLRVPIFSQMESRKQMRKAKINLSNSEYERIETENAITNNSLQFLNDFNSSREKYFATLSALQQNELSFAMYEEKYRLGQANSLELITAKQILNDANAKYLQAKFEVYFRYQLIQLLEIGF